MLGLRRDRETSLREQRYLCQCYDFTKRERSLTGQLAGATGTGQEMYLNSCVMGESGLEFWIID